jgi:hypothetical protein
MSNTIKYSTSSIANSTLVGSVAFGWAGFDYGPTENSGWYNGVTPPSGGYVVYATSASQIISATVADNTSSLLLIAQQLTGQTFTSASQSIDYLNSNGYAVADQVYTGNYSYSTTTLGWTDSTTGYTLLTGGVTSTDDGYWINPITIPTFSMNNVSSSLLYISTNAVATLGVGYGACCPSTPQTSNNPALMAGNPGDMYVNPGQSLTDGTVQNAFYRITSGSGRTKIELKVFQAILSGNNTPYSYQLNLYRDANYEWLETRVKTNATGRSGPYNNTDVSRPSSTVSGVWRGDLTGRNWVYLGTGSVVL